MPYFADRRILIGRLQHDRLQFVRGVGFRHLARLDDVGVADCLARLRIGNAGIECYALARRDAEHACGGLDERHPPRGPRTAHGVEVHHRAPAAAGDNRAQHRVVVLGIVADEIDAHVAPGRAEFLGDDLRHRAGDVLAHVGLADVDRDDPVGADAVPDRGIVGRRSRRRGSSRQRAEAADETGRAGAHEKRAAGKIERARDVLMFGHAFLPAPCASFDARRSLAARSMAFTMRG
jgi:hypothetical protein